MEKQGRIAWIDALLGFTMWLVVIEHVQFFGGCQGMIYNTLIAWFFMPLFFFVSGLVMYHPARCWSARTVVSYLWKKVLQILVPTTIMFILANWIIGYNIVEQFLNPMKAGYWVTITLFGFIALYVLFGWLMQVCKSGEKVWLSVLLLLTALVSFLLSRHGLYTALFGEKVMVFFDTLQVGKWCYFQFFVLGIIFRKYQDVFLQLINNRYAIGIVLVAYIFMAIVCTNGLPFVGVQRYAAAASSRLIPYTGILIVTTLFYSLRRFLSDSKTGHALCIVGQNTLGIYLIHYFFLPGNWTYLQLLAANTPPHFANNYIHNSSRSNYMLLFDCNTDNSAQSATCEIFDRG